MWRTPTSNQHASHDTGAQLHRETLRDSGHDHSIPPIHRRSDEHSPAARFSTASILLTGGTKVWLLYSDFLGFAHC